MIVVRNVNICLIAWAAVFMSSVIFLGGIRPTAQEDPNHPIILVFFTIGMATAYVLLLVAISMVWSWASSQVGLFRWKYKIWADWFSLPAVVLTITIVAHLMGSSIPEVVLSLLPGGSGEVPADVVDVVQVVRRSVFWGAIISIPIAVATNMFIIRPSKQW